LAETASSARTDRGDTWTRSDDLSRDQDREKLQIMGVLPDRNMLSRHDGVQTFGQVVTLAESTIKEGLLYAGTDDGNLHVSRDSGKTWKNITEKVPGVPKNTTSAVWFHHVSRKAQSTPPSMGIAGMITTRMFLFPTDFGDSWKSLKSDLPPGITCRVIREHPRNQNLLFLGTEFGALRFA
jgi:hypothetical protein